VCGLAVALMAITFVCVLVFPPSSAVVPLYILIWLLAYVGRSTQQES
jgi:hypothetical protein